MEGRRGQVARRVVARLPVALLLTVCVGIALLCMYWLGHHVPLHADSPGASVLLYDLIPVGVGSSAAGLILIARRLRR